MLSSITKIIVYILGAYAIGTHGQRSPVYLSIGNEFNVTNDGYVRVEDIGDYYHGPFLLCRTNNISCCSRAEVPNRSVLGNWHFPNGDLVESFGSSGGDSGTFFGRSRGPSSVNLFRNGAPSERGRFRCSLPDAAGINVDVYANILDIGEVTITQSTNATVGKYTDIVCSVDITPDPLPANVAAPTFDWFYGPEKALLPSGVIVSAVVKSGNTYTSTLQFPTLLLAHSGMYTCRLGGNDQLTANFELHVHATHTDCDGNTVTGSDTNVFVGDHYTLTCSCSACDSNVTYWTRWIKDNHMLLNETGPMLSFSSLKLSDAGRYFCRVTAKSTYYCGVKDISLEIPAPSFVTITSDSVSPIRPVGSDVSLTCSVDLSSAVDVPVTVNIEMRDPQENVLTISTPTLSQSVYVSEALITSFGRNQSGIYTCEATVSSPSPFLIESGTLSRDLRVTTNVYLSLGHQRYLENNTFVVISDLGTEAPHQLVCTTDRKPCCQHPVQYGEWYFSDGQQVKHISEGAVEFQRDRDDNGNVYLYRVGTDQTPDGGKFCCRVQDATDINQTLCVNIVSPVNIEIATDGTQEVGESYTLTCNVTGASVNYYEWRRNGEVLSNTGAILNIPALRLSDAGHYTCQVVVYIWTHNASHDIELTIPSPSISVVSNQSNPVRPLGSAVALTSTVQLSPAVDVPVTVNIVWSGPNGFTFSQTALPLVSAVNSYTSTALVTSFSRNHSGNYTCRAIISLESLMSIHSISSYATTQVTVGTYLSMNGEILPPDRVIFVTDIGMDLSEQHLVCTTDRMPCCRQYPRVGEWYFPNGDMIPINAAAVSFYRTRDNSGNVKLFRASNSITSPTGRFCCEIPDATDMNHTHCIDILPLFTVRVQDGGAIPVAGHTYYLTCDISGIENLVYTLTFQWTKNNGTITHVGTNSSTLSFSSLVLSDNGEYTCITTVSSSSLREDKVSRSKSYTVDIPIPRPILRLVSDMPLNLILSGSSPILTCSVELDPAVDVPVNTTTTWTRPDGMTLASAAPAMMRSLTHYTSKAKLNYVELADSGNYTCSVVVNSKTKASVSRIASIREGLFQLRLVYTDDCRSWYKSGDQEAELYKYHIEEALIEAIESRCECHFPRENFFEPTFSCVRSPHLTTYRNTLVGTYNFNATQLIEFIQDWVATGPQISVKHYSLWIDNSCPVAITSPREPECGKLSD